jgi:D-alanyl-D-alanine carboxypeptidase
VAGPTRRQLLRLGAVVPLVAALPKPRVGWAAGAPDLSSVREWVRRGVERGPDGATEGVFGLAVGVASEVLLRATKTDPLPENYAPMDAVAVVARGIPAVGAQQLRAIVVDDTRALIEAAAADGLRLYVGSGYRSRSYQVAVFAAQVARWGDEAQANRFSARPGHSQHQLGTTVDFTTEFRGFRESGAPDWLRANAHQFGFVLPYTTAAIERTGYVDEPWHGRWVGPALATQLHAAGYVDWTDLDADDVIDLVRVEAGLDRGS